MRSKRPGSTGAAALAAAISLFGLQQLFGLGLEFDDLSRWKEQPFLYVKVPSTYEIATLDGESVLSVSSKGGISALVFEEVVDVYETPVIEWRWRIDDFPVGADPRDADSDDFALRLYLMFQYDPGTIPFVERIKFKFVKLFYDEHPPKKVIGFVWSEIPFTEPYLDSTLNSRTRYLDVGVGAALNEWRTVRVDIVEEYRRAFGEDPPSSFRISVIGDSDSTGDSTLGYIDYIRVSTD